MLQRNNDSIGVFYCDRLAIGKDHFSLFLSPFYFQASVMDRYIPWKWIDAFQPDACVGKDLHPQDTQEQIHRSQSVERIALAHAGPIFRVVARIERTVLSKILDDTRHHMCNQTRSIAAESVSEQAFPNELVPWQVNRLRHGFRLRLMQRDGCAGGHTKGPIETTCI